MKLPVTDLTSNLVFTRSGTIWATWRLEAVSYGYRPNKEKLRIKRLHEELLQAFRGEVMISAITASLDPVAVAEQMIAGIDLSTAPEWADEVAATLDMLEDTTPGTRTFWLSVPLKPTGAKDWTRRQWEVFKTILSETMALPRSAPAHQVIEEALTNVARIQTAIPARFKARPATPAEHVWLALHHQQRGLNLDTMVPTLDPSAEVGVEDAFGHRSYPEPYLEPAGHDEDAEKETPIYRRRWLKVVNDDRASFQVTQAITSMPAGGFAFPGGEWMQQADEMPFAVDWVWRMQIDSAARAKLANKKAETRYRNQLSERTDDARLTGSSNELGETAQQIVAFQCELGRSSAEVKVATAVLFSVGAPTAALAQQKADILKDTYNEMEVRLERFMGKQQEDLWWQMQIGTPTISSTRGLMHETTGWNLAGAVPITNNALGGRTGMLLGWNISSGTRAPVLLDLETQLMGDHSASIGIAGELGGGKTWTTKRIGGDTIDRGGRIVVIDRSNTREWATYSDSITDSASLDLGNVKYTLDPLRILGPIQGAPYVENLATQLLNISLTDDAGIALAEALRPEHLAAQDITSMPELMRFLLSTESGNPEAIKLGKRMKAFESRALGQSLFDSSLPPMPMDSPGLVFCTHDLSLPAANEVNQEHLFSQLGPEKIFGRALYTLMARLAQRVCFENQSDLAGFITPEAHHLTSNQQGQEIASTFIKEGRKTKAFIVMDSHDPDEFGTSGNLIPTRLVMRHTDRDMARKCLKWLDLDPTSDDLVDEIMSLSPLGEGGAVVRGREGEGFLLDPFQNIGKIQISAPARPARLAAISSRPKDKVA